MQRAVAAALLASATAAGAEAPGDPPVIIITGRALPAAETLGTSQLLDSQALEVPARRLDVALQQVPTLQLFRRASSASASQTAQGLTLRGLGGNAASRMAVTLDGVPQADLFAGWVAFVPLSATPLESALVEPGAGGARLFGGAAPGGRIGLQSALGESRIQLRGGSRDAFDASASVALPAGQGSFALFGAHAEGAGHLLVDPALAGPADVPARFRQSAGGGRLVVPLGAETELQVRLAAFTDRRRRGTRQGLSLAEGADAAVRLVHRGRWGVEALAYGQLRDFAMRAVAVDPGRTIASVTLDQFATPASGWGAGVMLRPPAGPGTDLALGLDWRQAEGRTRERFNFQGGVAQGLREAGGRQQEGSLFADIRLRPADAVTLGGTARLQHWRLSGGVLREIAPGTGALLAERIAPDRSGTDWAAAAGIALRPPGARALRLHVEASRGIRLPTLNELHRPFRIGNDVTGANPGLAPERLRMIEAGIGFQPLATVVAELVAFDARLDGAIANVTLGQGPGSFPGVGFVPAGGEARQRRNIGAILSRGVEARGSLDAGLVRLDAALATADARVEGGAGAPGLDGTRPAQVPAFTGSATLALRPAEGVRLSATLRHQSARFEDDRNRRRLAPATTLDLAARLPLRPGLTLTLDAENLTDAVVETGFLGALAERATPRSVWVGLELRPAQSGR